MDPVQNFAPQSSSSNLGSKSIFIGVCVFALLVLGNLLYLDFKSTQRASVPEAPANPSTSLTASSSSVQDVPLTEPLATTNSGCNTDCQNYVNQQIAAAKTEVLQSISSTPQSSSIPIPTPTASTPHPLNYYLSFGSDGSTQATSYVSLDGTQISFNPSDYPGAKAFYFQANLRSDAPDKGTWARIVNTSTGGGLPGSDISINGGLSSAFVESGGVSMPSGTTTLQVQVHSLDGNFAYVEGAKLRIAY